MKRIIVFAMTGLCSIGLWAADATASGNADAKERLSPEKIMMTFAETGQQQVVYPPSIHSGFFYNAKVTCAEDRMRHPLLLDRELGGEDIPFWIGDVQYQAWVGDSRYGRDDKSYYFVDVKFKTEEACLKPDYSKDQIESVAFTFVHPDDRAFMPIFGKTLKLEWDVVAGSATIYRILDFDKREVVATGQRL